MQKYIYIGVIALLVAGFLGYSMHKPGSTFGSASAGIPAAFSTSTAAVSPTTQTQLFATSTNCTARVISTTAAPIMLTFSEKNAVVPTALVGFLQAASTTVNYDAGVYGCDAWHVISATGAAGTLTIGEYR